MPLPILMYHEIEATRRPAKRYSVAADVFAKQLGMLRERGLEAVTLDAAWCGRQAGAWPDTPRRIAITFDDSDLSLCTQALPLLVEHQVRATFFVVTGFIGQGSGCMSLEQLKSIGNAGMSIQSHSHTHPFLDGLADTDLRDQLQRSKNLLEDWLGKAVTSLSCPGGRYSRRVVAMAREVGYLAVFTSVPGFARRPSHAGGIATYPRLIVTSATSLSEYGKILDGDPVYAAARRGQYEAKRMAKKLIGSSAYHALWQRVAKFRAVGPGADRPRP